MDPARTLSEAEITALVDWHCGIPADQWGKITEPYVIADPHDRRQVAWAEWRYEDRIQFLLENAQHGRPH